METTATAAPPSAKQQHKIIKYMTPDFRVYCIMQWYIHFIVTQTSSKAQEVLRSIFSMRAHSAHRGGERKSHQKGSLNTESFLFTAVCFEMAFVSR